MKVIGTAGHIDHGKSALVQRLTGMDPDRLAEEKQRGMTIDLGFAWLTLPSGLDVSIVDVPGHERFVKNMLAGAGGVDIALLVVAADEAVMPQTREHLDILDLLGVRHGVVALTKVDLVDEEWRELARAEVLDALQGTTLEGSPIMPVSSVTGEGIPDLLVSLDQVVAASPEPVDRGLPFVPVDRVFTVSGFGTIVTGTLHGGRVVVGDEVELVPGGRRGRLRSLQTHRQHVDRADPGARVALNVAGIARDEINRGDVLALPGTVRALRSMDARLRVLRDAPFPLAHGVEVMLHIGAAERTCSLHMLDGDTIEPGGEGWVQLRCAEPVPALRGQRFIVRLPAPARTVAGGEVVDVAPRHRRRDLAALQRLADLSSASDERAVLAAVPQDKPRAPAQIAALMGQTPEATIGLLGKLELQHRVVRLGTSYIRAEGWSTAIERVRQALQAYHAAYPLRRGMPKEELRSKLRWGRPVWPATLKALADAGVVHDFDAVVASVEHRGGTASRRDEADRVLALLLRDPFSPPSGSELLAAAGTDANLLAAMTEEGEIVRVAEGLFFALSAYERMVAATLQIIREEGEVSVARIRDALGTSRKYALAFLEHLDTVRVTRRLGDVRVLGNKAPACA